MKRDNNAVRPDLSTQAWTLGQDHTADLSWAYPGEATQALEATDLDALALPAEWDKKRIIWLLLGQPEPATLQALLERITPCSKLVVVDSAPPQSTAITPLQQAQLSAWLADERVQLVMGGSVAQQAEAAATLMDIDLHDGWKPVIGADRMQADPLGVTQLVRGVSTALNTRVLMKSTKLKMSAMFLRNTLLNAPWTSVAQPLGKLANTQTNRPALIVSAGPSLNKQLPLLQAHQDLFTIIAVDTVWPILTQHGIVPDYLAALDPVTPASWPLNGIHPQTRLVTDVMASPAMVWSHERSHLFTYSFKPAGTLMNFLQGHADPLDVGGSVATQAFNLAVELGANPIFFIGQDLALTGGKDHADGYLYTYAEKTLTDRTESGYDVEAYHGGRIRTERQLLSYKHWFEDRIRSLPDRMVINATEGGARIAGTLQIPFAQICAEIAATSLRKPVNEPEPTHELDIEHMQRLLAGMDKLIDSVEDYRQLAVKAEAITQRKVSAKNDRQLKDIDRINRQIKGFEAHAKMLIDAFGANMLEKVRLNTHIQSQSEDLGPRQQHMESTLTRYREVYQGIQASAEACDKLLRRIRGLYQRILAEGRLDLSQLHEAMK